MTKERAQAAKVERIQILATLRDACLLAEEHAYAKGGLLELAVARFSLHLNGVPQAHTGPLSIYPGLYGQMAVWGPHASLITVSCAEYRAVLEAEATMGLPVPPMGIDVSKMRGGAVQ